ncbi:MAG: NotI family restriction endonuclease [Bacteroidota bacterium]
MSSNPLAEVFGFPINNRSAQAERYRKSKLCPFNNKVPSCTKDKANDPLGVCSIFEENQTIITCPVRFREDWLIAENAAQFFFKADVSWTSLAEVKLTDRHGNAAGNIDLVLVSYDERGRLIDFGSLEIQAVYISGNIRRPFERYVSSRHRSNSFTWGEPNYPKADFLSSSRKRLAPQMLYKGGILKAWHKKQAVALQTAFFDKLPKLKEVAESRADIAWLLYDLKLDEHNKRYKLIKNKVVYTEFEPALKRITTAEPGRIEEFIESLQQKLDEKLEGNPPDAPTIADITLTE